MYLFGELVLILAVLPVFSTGVDTMMGRLITRSFVVASICSQPSSVLVGVVYCNDK